MPKIYYLAPDYDVPSWGVALLYHHVRILRGLGFEASVLHEREPFRLTWLDVDVPVLYLDADLELWEDDIVVVPEVNASARAIDTPCRRVVFVQGGFLIFAGVEKAFEYRDLGYEAVMVTMPHLRDIVATHCGLVPELVPPFVAPYFFATKGNLRARRRHQVLIACKPEYRKAGYLDYDIACKLLKRHFSQLAARTDEPPWELVVLEKMRHADVAATMKKAAILINLNSLEAFNVTVAEAMASGCIPLCYEAYGGRDYLRHGENAYVFANNHVFPLVDAVIELTKSYSVRGDELAAMRNRAFATACEYQERATAKALDRFFRNLLA